MQPPFTQIPPADSYHRYAADAADHLLPPPPTQILLPAAPLADASLNIPPAHRRSSAKPVVKVAGARRPVADVKGKGKAPDTLRKSLKRAAATELTSAQAKKARGRSVGAANYRDDDLDALMDIAEVIVPVGKKGWNTVAVEFAEWAKENGRPERSSDSLEKKFKQVVRMEKPTGQADCPLWLDRAHAIYNLMDEKVTTRDVDDEDIADEPLELSSSDELEEELTMELLTRKPTRKTPAVKVKKEPTSPSVTVSRRAQTATLPRTTVRNASNEFLRSVSNALDPHAHSAMAEERATRSILQTQIFSLTTQLRDEKSLTELLRNRITDLDHARSDLLRKLDRQEMYQAIQKASGRSARTPRTPVERKKQRRQDITYADGMATIWVGSDESDHQRDSPTTVRYTHDYSPTPAHVTQPSPEKTASTSAL